MFRYFVNGITVVDISLSTDHTLMKCASLQQQRLDLL